MPQIDDYSYQETYKTPRINDEDDEEDLDDEESDS